MEITYGNLILASNGKRGNLPADENGNYRINSGGFNIPNHAGIRYPANKYIQDQMKDNSDLQMRIFQGMCYMECEHPEPYNLVYRNGVGYKEEMTSILQWIARLRSYDDARIVGVVSKIIFTFDEPGNMNAPIWTEILAKPLLSYPMGKQFKENLDTPEANTAVSIRTEIEPFDAKTRQKNVVYWTGFDWVKMPGMVHANKHMSAGCESYLDGQYYEGETKTYQVKAVIEALEQGIRDAANDPKALTRYGGMEALDFYKGELERVKQNYVRGESIAIQSGIKRAGLFLG